MPSFARPSCLLPVLGCVAVSLLAMACDPEPAGLTVTSISPQPVEQTGLLHIFGEDFGEFVQDRSGVLVSGVCAHVALWRNDRLAILVPEDIGTGTRVLQIHRADGSVATREVLVTGENLAFDGERPTCRFAAGTPGGGGGGGGDTTDPPDDGVDPDVPPDTSIPDFVSSCPIAVAPGACTGEDDCALLLATPEAEFQRILFECAALCVPEGGQLAACVNDCLELRVSLSSDCASCFGESAACAAEQCLSECAANPASDACESCRRARCGPTIDCTGLLYDTVGGPIPPDEELRFVQLVGLDSANDLAPGPEIDTVLVERADGSVRNVRDVVRANIGEGVDPGDPSQMIGAPDAFFTYPDTSICQSFGVWSMGIGGTTVLAFAEPLLPGDQVRVLELGDCQLVDTPVGDFAEPEPVEVSVGPTPEGPFTPIGIVLGPRDTLTVP